MEYPNIEQVEKADHLQLCEWFFFLPIPYWQKLGRGKTKRFVEGPVTHARHVFDTICKRYYEMGGITPEIKEKLWDKHDMKL